MGSLLGHHGLMLAGSGSSVPAVTWNPADKASGIVLSSGDLVAGRTGSDGYQSVRATLARSAGKYYYEAVPGAGTSSSMMVGLASATANLNSFVGGDASGFGYNASNGSTYNSSSQSTYGSTYAPGDVIGVLWDADSGIIKFSKNGVLQNGGTPAYFIATGAVLFPMASIYEATSGQTWIGRFKASAFTQTIPSGYAAWES